MAAVCTLVYGMIAAPAGSIVPQPSRLRTGLPVLPDFSGMMVVVNLRLRKAVSR